MGVCGLASTEAELNQILLLHACARDPVAVASPCRLNERGATQKRDCSSRMDASVIVLPVRYCLYYSSVGLATTIVRSSRSYSNNSSSINR